MIVARINSVRLTNFQPAISDFHEIGSLDLGWCVTFIAATKANAAMPNPTSARYTGATPFSIAISTPPSPGPITAATCQALLRQVTALLKSFAGTSCGTSAHLAGSANALAMPATPIAA